MANRYSIAWFILLMGLSASIFFFLRNEDDNAISLLFVTLYACVTIIYFLRIFFYTQHKATLNEVYFFSLANLIPLGILVVSPFVPLQDEIILNFVITITPSSLQEPVILNITIFSILAFPYLAISTALLIRSFTRYQFIRLTPRSTKGPSAEWTALLTFFIFGILFIWAGLFASDLIGLLYGIFFLFSGIGFLFGK